MKYLQHFSFLSLALVTLIGAGCTEPSPAEVGTTTASPETETDTQAAISTPPIEVSAENELATSPEALSTNTTTAPITENTSVYANGAYTATGTYTSPGGKESLPVTLTLEDGVIVDASVQTPATNPASQKFQTIFAENFKVFVVGKNIDDLNLTHVSGSSLTPQGFNDAVAQIKIAAQS